MRANMRTLLPAAGRTFASADSCSGATRTLVRGDTKYVEGTLAEYNHHFQKKMFFNERFVAWMSAWLPATDISYFVRNDRENPVALYHWLSKATLYSPL